MLSSSPLFPRRFLSSRARRRNRLLRHGAQYASVISDSTPDPIFLASHYRGDDIGGDSIEFGGDPPNLGATPRRSDWRFALMLCVWIVLLEGLLPAVAAEQTPSSAAPQGGSLPVKDASEPAAQALAQGRFQEAAALYTRALSREPDRVDHLLARGKALEMCNRPDKALQDYKTALEIDPGNVGALIASASILEMNPGSESEALALYHKALPLITDGDARERVIFNIAVLETRIKDETTSAVGCWNVGNRYARKGDANAAETFFSRALELNPAFYQAYYNRALTRLKKNNTEGALQDLSAAIPLCPSLRGLLVTRGLLYESQGSFEKAMADLKRAATEDPTDPEAHYHLGRLQEREQAYSDALASYLEAARRRPKPELRDAIAQRIAALARAVKPAPRPEAPQQPLRPLW